MKELRRKVLLPALRLSTVTDQDDPFAIKRTIKQGKGRPELTYYYRLIDASSDKNDGTQGGNYNLFPVILDRKSNPWSFGTLYILDVLQGQTQPYLSTSHGHATDLGAFKEWLDTDENPDETIFNFPRPKLRRTTYRYRGFLQQQIRAGEVSTTTAKRRMGTVVAFYRWLIEKGYFVPEYNVWEDKEYQFSFKTRDGRQILRKQLTTDLSIPAPKSEDSFDGTIQDGGKLRPLTSDEQMWVLEAAEEKANTECLLLQLFMLSTGARIESACTLRARHFAEPSPKYSKSLTGGSEVFRLKAGPGTGIETKNNKQGILQVPRPLYELLHVYCCSMRAKNRRMRFVEKQVSHPDVYLFLTQQGNPYYIAKQDSLRFNPDLDRRHEKVGQTVRQFIKEQSIPYVRKNYDSSFFYRPHDLRASFGMNTMQSLMNEVQMGRITLHQARLILKDLMWHASMATTDLYLDYKNKLISFYGAIDGFGEKLQQWTERAKKGLTIDE